MSFMDQRGSDTDQRHAPALLHLSHPLPCSLSQLGLTFAHPSSPSASPLRLSAPPPPAAAASSSSSSFRVRSIYVDDVAQDAILVCEESVTLFVPLTCSDKFASSSSRSPLTGGSHSPRDPSPPISPAVAVGLRLGNPHQAWSPPPPSTAAASAVAGTSTTHPVEDGCLPRRLPLAAAELRRAASVLVAVPVLSLPSTVTSAAATPSSSSSSGTDSSAKRAITTVMSIVIVECAVLPEGVDGIDAIDIPLARPLKKILCAPNTLRFREAWYPLQFFCWCGPLETMGVASCAATPVEQKKTVSGVDGRGSHHARHEGASPDNVEDDNGSGSAGDPEATAGVPPYSDYHLLCVSSISVDLLRVRHHQAVAGGAGDHHRAPGHHTGRTASYQPDIATMMNAGRAVSSSAVTTADTRQEQQQQHQQQRDAPAVTAPRNESEVVITVLQRYVTRTDWCAYESRSRTLVSINYARPDVLKPMTVLYERVPRAGGVLHETQNTSNTTGLSPGSSFPSAAVSASSPRQKLAVSLCKFSELTLPESLCASLLLHSLSATSSSPLPQDSRVARLLHAVVGVFTAYGLTFFYHVPAPQHPHRTTSTSNNARTSGSGCAARMHVYVYLPDSASAVLSSPSSPTSPNSSFPSTATPITTAYGEARRSSDLHRSADNTGGPSKGEDEAYPAVSFFKRFTVAASAATASATPPRLCGGTYVKVAELSLDELLPASSSAASTLTSTTAAARSPTSASSPSSLSTPAFTTTNAAAPSVSPLSHSFGAPSQRQLQQLQQQSFLAALSVQVVGDVLLLHNPRSSMSAVYDLAEPPEIRATDSRRYDSDMKSVSEVSPRDFLVWVTASERSRRWARTHNTTVSTTAHPHNASASNRGEEESGAHARRNVAGGSNDPLWSRAAGSDWASMVSAVASTVLEFSSAVEAITGSNTPAAAWGDGRAVPLLRPLCSCTATMNVTPDCSASTSRADGTSPAVARAASATCAMADVPYVTCVWPSSSRVALVVSKHDGGLRRCELDLPSLAEWLLLVRASQATQTTQVSLAHAVRGSQAAKSAVAVSSASLGQLIAFACRHPSSTLPPPASQQQQQQHQQQQQQGESDEDCDDGKFFICLLKDLAACLVFGHSPESDSEPRDGSYAAVVRRHLSPSSTPGSALFSHWVAIIERLSVEAELMGRFSQLAERRMLTELAFGMERSADGFLRCSDDDEVHTRERLHSSWGLRLQARLTEDVFRPLCRALRDQSYAMHQDDDAATSTDASSTVQRQQQQRLQLYVQRCEDLMCGYVRLLRSLAIPVLPALQELLLEVVLKCDLHTGGLIDLEDSAATSTASRPATTAAAAILRSAEQTARRARALLRQGVLEESSTTARSLLGWWERFRYHLAAAQQDELERARASSGPASTPDVAVGEGKDETSAAHDCTNTVDNGCPAAEALFQEAVRLFELHGHLLEVVEAYRWRHDYAAATAALLRTPRDTPSIEITEVHGGARRSLTSARNVSSSSSSVNTSAATTPRRHASRLLTWDTLAVAVLDGAWGTVREAEEVYYVLAEQTTAAARSVPHTVPPTSPSSPGPGQVPSVVEGPPPPWRLRAAQRNVQAAHGVYLSAASAILTLPGLTARPGPSARPPTPPATTTAAAAVLRGGEPTTEFNPTLSEELRGGRGHLPLPHLRPHHFNPISSSVSAGYHAHEVRYLQLRQQVEMDWHHLKSAAEAA